MKFRWANQPVLAQGLLLFAVCVVKAASASCCYTRLGSDDTRSWKHAVDASMQAAQNLSQWVAVRHRSARAQLQCTDELIPTGTLTYTDGQRSDCLPQVGGM